MGVVNENKQKTEPSDELIDCYVHQINQQDREMFPDEQSSNETDFYVEIFMNMQRKNSGCNEILQEA